MLSEVRRLGHDVKRRYWSPRRRSQCKIAEKKIRVKYINDNISSHK